MLRPFSAGAEGRGRQGGQSVWQVGWAQARAAAPACCAPKIDRVLGAQAGQGSSQRLNSTGSIDRHASADLAAACRQHTRRRLQHADSTHRPKRCRPAAGPLPLPRACVGLQPAGHIGRVHHGLIQVPHPQQAKAVVVLRPAVAVGGWEGRAAAAMSEGGAQQAQRSCQQLGMPCCCCCLFSHAHHKHHQSGPPMLTGCGT